MTRDLFGEISLDLLSENPSLSGESHIVQVFTYYKDVKVYLFYIYHLADKVAEQELENYIQKYRQDGANTPNVHSGDIIIVKGVHELINLWENST